MQLGWLEINFRTDQYYFYNLITVEKKAIKDYKGSYGSATAKCRVRFVRDEGVFVEGYSFVKSG